MQPYSHMTYRTPTSTISGVTTNLPDIVSRAISLSNVTGYYGPKSKADHPRTYQFEDRTYPRGSIVVWGSVKDTRENAFTSFVPVNGHMPEVPAFLEAKAISKFYERLKHTSLNLGEDIGEMRQTKKMIEDFYSAGKTGLTRAQTAAANQVLSEYRGRYGRRRGAPRLTWRMIQQSGMTAVEFNLFGDQAPWTRRLDKVIKKLYLDSFCKTWLLATYGLGPLISTLQGLVKFVESKLGQHFRVNATCIDFGRAEYKDTLPDYPVSMNVVCTYKHIVKYGATFRVRDNVAFDLSRVNFFALPFKTLYDLTAFSFVLDWVIDVGSWIEAVERSLMNTSGADGLDLLAGYCTRYTACTYQSNTDWSAVPSDGWIKPNPYVWYSPSEIWSTSTVKYTSRTLLYSLPYMDLPVFNIDMGWRRLTSFGALMSLVVLPPKVAWLREKFSK